MTDSGVDCGKEPTLTHCVLVQDLLRNIGYQKYVTLAKECLDDLPTYLNKSELLDLNI